MVRAVNVIYEFPVGLSRHGWSFAEGSAVHRNSSVDKISSRRNFSVDKISSHRNRRTTWLYIKKSHRKAKWRIGALGQGLHWRQFEYRRFDSDPWAHFEEGAIGQVVDAHFLNETCPGQRICVHACLPRLGRHCGNGGRYLA